MKHILILSGLLVFAGTLFAQPEVIWVEPFGGGGTDQGLAVMETADGNICVSGNETSFGGGGTDGWVIMIDLEGDEIWSVNYGGNGYDRFYDLVQVEDGFVTGGYTGSIGAGQFDYWLFKMDGEGNQVWSRSFGGRDYERSGTTVQTTNGGFAMVGNTLSFGAGGSDGWLVVTDEDGQEDWTMPYGGDGDDYLNGAVSMEDGGFVLAGRTTSQGEGGLDAWLFRVDNEGEEVWSHTYGGDEDDNILSMKQTNDGGYIMAGYTASFAEDGSDFWLIKTDEDGEEVWSHNYDQGTDEQCREVIQTFDGGYLMGGHNWAYDDQRGEALLVRTDDEGEVLWMETYGGNQPDVITRIVQIADGGYVFTGWTTSFGAGGLDVWVVRLGPEPAGVLQGFVLDAEDDFPLEGASITTTNGLSAETDEEGFFVIEPAWAGDFEMTASLQGYNDQTIADLSLEFDDTLEVTFSLTHPEIEPSRDSFEAELEPDDSQEFEFSVSNNGNGPLTYTIDRRLLGEANADPWELRRSDDVQDLVGDDMLNGVVFAEGHFFVSGGNSGEDVNKIYVISTEGEQIDEFDQFSESRYGMRDLAYDGALIWGADNGTLYGFNTDGELASEFEAPVDIECRSLTWDSDHNVLLASDIASEIYAIDLNGELIETYERPDEIRIYGLAYWQNDPDGHNLYVFNRGTETDLQVSKINLENGDFTVAAELNIDGGRPGGVQITNELDVYSWVLVSIVQNPDRLAIWQLEGRREWFQVEPLEGVIEAEESEDFTLTLDATGLPPENVFEGEVVFVHNAMEAETALSVTLNVFEGEVRAVQEIPLEIGWNLISAQVQPDNPEDIIGLMSQLVEEDLLIIMKNSAGQFYRPDYDYNNIPRWNVGEGYQILVSADCVFRIEGIRVLRDRPIDLQEGWQIVSYYPRSWIEPQVALSGIVDHLLIAKDGRGNFYLPDWEFCNMWPMRPGQGYYLNVDADCELVYRMEREEAAGLLIDDRRYLPKHIVTPENMSLLVLAEDIPPLLLQERTAIPPLLLQGGIKGGVEVGIYAGGQLVGSGVFNNGQCGIAVWGDDPMTDEIDGALEGQELELRLVDDNGIYMTDFETLSGKLVYQTDSFCVVKLSSVVEAPTEFGIVSVYPNPFNSTATITYSLPTAARVELKLFDLTGREIATLVDEAKQPGIHTATLTASELPAGLYFVRLEASRRVLSKKVMLIK